jgi:predicted RecA/RadA family phage recombinase
MQARLMYGGGGEIHLTAAAVLQPGDIVLGAGHAAVVSGCAAIAIGDRFAAYTKGVFEVDSASATTFTVGAEVEWDDTTNLAVAAAGGTFDLGRAAKAKIATELKVWVNLNEVAV